MQQYRKNLGKVSLTAEGAWNLNNSYDILSIVYDEHTQHGFISRKAVPQGVDLYNKEYWMPLNVSGYADNNVIILSKKTSEASIQSYTLEEAITSIKSVGRRPGAILGFYNENNDRLDIGGRWELWQFNDTNVYNWENVDSWQNLYYNYNKFMGWFKDENFLNKYAPFPEIGCYAFVGSEFNEATVYRCDNKYVWNNTTQHAWDYVKVIVDGNVTVGENGNWFNNGEDTGIPASVKGENGKTPIFREKDNTIQYSFENVNWITISGKVAAWFRWNATTGDTQANNVGRIQISRDNVTWTNLSGDIINNLHISRYIGTDETLPTSGIAEGTIYAKGPTYADGDTSHANPIYRLWVYAWKGNTLAWQDNGEFTSIAAGVVQETGDSETEIMSQKVVTEKLSELGITQVVTLEGKGETGVYDKVYNLIANKRYRVYLLNKWNAPEGLTSGKYVFELYYQNSEGKLVTLTGVKQNTSGLRDYYDVILPETTSLVIYARIAEGEIATFQVKEKKVETNIITDSFLLYSNSSHSSDYDKIDVDIKEGESINILLKINEDLILTNLFRVYAKYKGESPTVLIADDLFFNKPYRITAVKDIESIGFFIGENYVSEDTNVYVFIEKTPTLFGLYSFSNLYVSDVLNQHHGNIKLLEKDKLLIRKEGFKIYNGYGVALNLNGSEDKIIDFSLLGESQGCLYIKKDLLINGGDFNWDNENILYVDRYANITSDYINLLGYYYGRIINVGLFSELIRTNILPLNVSDTLNQSRNNITLLENNRGVSIKKSGFRIISNTGSYLDIVGSEDYIALASDFEGQGWWCIHKKNIPYYSNITKSWDDGIIELKKKSDDISQYVILFGAYYGQIISTGLFESILRDKINISNENILDNAFLSPYNPTDIEPKSQEFCSLFKSGGDIDTYLFFTDPHLFQHNLDESWMKGYISLLNKYYNRNPLSFIMCGGDWLQSQDTQDQACSKLGYIDGMMNGLFDNYYPIFGNHDNNYQGKLNEDSEDNTGELSVSVMTNLWFRKWGKTYYSFKSNTTKYIIMDDGTDWNISMNDHRWGQIDWLFNELVNNNNPHIVIAKHMHYYTSDRIAPMQRNVIDMCSAFNNRTSIVLNEKTYDFSAISQGKVEYITVGHNHKDFNIIDNGIIIIGTTRAVKEGLLTFDLVYADYSNKVLNLIRVGSGENRLISLSTD